MRNPIERARKAIWILKQPLTQKPKVTGVPVSDLFVWRNSDEWKTFFELTDLSGLFVDQESMPERYATICFFDSSGTLFLEKRLDLHPNQRKTLDLSLFVSESKCSFGTFSIFHSYTPQVVTDLGSFITERGYVSYRYNGAHLRAYVHGNLDAICQLPDMSKQLLGSSSFLAREYRLQHELTGPAQYEIIMVNPISHQQRIYCHVQSTRNSEVLDTQEVKLRPGGSHVFLVNMEQGQAARIIIGSHLVMARPLVFRINNNIIEVFHG